VSGLIRGRVECVVPGIAVNLAWQVNAQACFKVLYDFFTSHPNYSLVASYYGVTSPLVFNSPTGGSGTGTGFWDEAHSFGFNAFFVVRAKATAARPFDVYHLFQWGGPTNYGAPSFGSSTGTTALIMGNNGSSGQAAYLGHQAAIGIGGTGGSALSPGNGNPWKGTTNANGTDTKPASTSIWGAPAGGGTGVIVFPRSCDSNWGSFRTQAQNCGQIMNWAGASGQQTRWHVVADDDSFVIAIDFSDQGLYCMSYSGIYQPRTSISVAYPYLVIDTADALPFVYTAESIYGDVAGTATRQGGIVQALTGSVAGLQLDHYSSFATDVNFWPNRQFATPTFDQLDVPVGIYEPSPGGSYSGMLGQIDFFREMYNVPTNAVSTDYSRIFVGGTAVATTKYAIPWDSQNKTVPRSGYQRQGVSFVGPALSTLT